MFGILFRIEYNPEKLHELIGLFRLDRDICSKKEPGTLRFEFYHNPEDENVLYVYEAYRDFESESFEEHKKKESRIKTLGNQCAGGIGNQFLRAVPRRGDGMRMRLK